MQSSQVAATPAGRAMLQPSCLKCPHIKICDVFKGTARMLAANYPPLEDGTQTAPFKAEEIAKVCALYVAPGQAEIAA